jgi:hypothetical protein
LPGSPRIYGWLLYPAPVAVGPHANQLGRFLAEPEVAAMVAASPALQDLLRPLLRALAMEPGAVPPAAAALPRIFTPRPAPPPAKAPAKVAAKPPPKAAEPWAEFRPPVPAHFIPFRLLMR